MTGSSAFQSFWALTSSVTSLLMCIMEVIRSYQEIDRLSKRYQAYHSQDGLKSLNTYDSTYYACAVYIPSTDCPIHPLGFPFAPAFHLLSAIMLLYMFLTELPLQNFSKKYGSWLKAFGPDAGTWYVGFLQMFVSSFALANPIVYPWGPDQPRFKTQATAIIRYTVSSCKFFV